MSPTDDIITRRKAMLHNWIAGRVDAPALSWLDTTCSKVAASGSDSLLLAIAQAPRRFGKAALARDAALMASASDARPGLDTMGWTVTQTARILFVLESYKQDDVAFASTLDAAVRGGELNEQIDLLQGLPLYPAPALLVPIAVEGLRTAMQPIFESVAHRSPFPMEYFSEQQWNQMVLKALFIGSRLSPIVGLDARRNADLSATLIDYAHERWAAGRDVSPELWRCVGPFARDRDLPDLAKALASTRADEAQAAALALAECPLPEAARLLKSQPSLARQIETGSVSWTTFR